MYICVLVLWLISTPPPPSPLPSFSEICQLFHATMSLDYLLTYLQISLGSNSYKSHETGSWSILFSVVFPEPRNSGIKKIHKYLLNEYKRSLAHIIGLLVTFETMVMFPTLTLFFWVCLKTNQIYMQCCVFFNNYQYMASLVQVKYT